MVRPPDDFFVGRADRVQIMGSYFALMNAEKRGLQVAHDQDLGGFNYLIVRDDKPVGKLPGDVQLYVKGKKPADLLANTLSWTIVSDRMYQLMEPFLTRTPHETLDPQLVDDATREPLRGFKLLHPLLTINALHKYGGGFISLLDMVVDTGKVPENVHLFKLGESPSTVVISKPLMEALEGQGLQGVAVVVLEDAPVKAKKKQARRISRSS